MTACTSQAERPPSYRQAVLPSMISAPPSSLPLLKQKMLMFKMKPLHSSINLTFYSSGFCSLFKSSCMEPQSSCLSGILQTFYTSTDILHKSFAVWFLPSSPRPPSHPPSAGGKQQRREGGIASKSSSRFLVLQKKKSFSFYKQ